MNLSPHLMNKKSKSVAEGRFSLSHAFLYYFAAMPFMISVIV